MGSPEERERALEQERDQAARTYLEAARALSEARRKAAPDLEKKMEGELALLAMERTRFGVRFDPETPDGRERLVDRAAAWSEPSSSSPRTPARSCVPWPGSPPAASCRASCWPSSP